MMILLNLPAAVNPIAEDVAPDVEPAPYSAADLEWAARELNADAADYDVEPVEPDYDAMAEESAALDRLEAGYCC